MKISPDNRRMEFRSGEAAKIPNPVLSVSNNFLHPESHTGEDNFRGMQPSQDIPDTCIDPGVTGEGSIPGSYRQVVQWSSLWLFFLHAVCRVTDVFSKLDAQFYGVGFIGGLQT